MLDSTQSSDGVITKPSSKSVAQTIDGLRRLIAYRGFTVFNVIDHSACECCVHSAGIEPGISRWAAMCRLSSTCRALSLCVAGRRAAGTRPLAVRSASMSG